jgi:Carboxypeptidase regulatory-like domain
VASASGGKGVGPSIAPHIRSGEIMRLCHILLGCAVMTSAACRPGPILDTSPKRSVGGTIAGIVTTSDSSIPVVGRKVWAVDVATGRRSDATTGVNGGYTIKVPEGTYRLEVELRDGEAVAKQPDQTHINNSDLDPGRDFVITVKK